MLRKLFIVIALVIAVATPPAVVAVAPVLWEEIAPERAASVGMSQPSSQNNSGDDSSGVELTVASNGTVYLSLPRTMTVEVFTILGQPISRENLKAGIYRLKLRSRGIYILRVGSITRRITI